MSPGKPVHRRNRVLIGVLVVLLIIGVFGGFVAATFTEPAIESIDNRWGEVTDATSEIQTEVVVDNPNVVPVPPILTLEYGVRLNSVTVAFGQVEGVGFPRGRSELHFSSSMNNAKIAPWWRTHVERDERTTLSIDPQIRVQWLGTLIDLPKEREQIRTEIIRSMNDEPSQPIPLDGEQAIRLEGVTAAWGEPTANQTPIKLTLTVDNQLDDQVSVEEVDYALLLNDVNVGGDDPSTELQLAANGTTIVQITAVIVNERMNEWWVTHLRNGEVTQLSIELSGTVVVEGIDQRRFTVPIQNTTIETDVLGEG